MLWFCLPSHAKNESNQLNVDLSPEIRQAFEDYYFRFKQRAIQDIVGINEKEKHVILDELIAIKRLRRVEKVEEAHRRTLEIQKRYPNQALLMWHVAMSFYHQNAVADESNISLRIKLLRQGRPFAEACLKKAPEDANCWISKLGIIGREAALNGVFASLFAVDEIFQVMSKAHRFSRAAPYPNGPFSTNHQIATFALVEFYRALPDLWVVEWITGHRGDKKKSYRLAKTLKQNTIVNAVGLGKAAMCLGGLEEKPELVKEGLQALEVGNRLPVVHPSEFNQLKRLKLALNAAKNTQPRDFDRFEEIGCSDYGNDDEEAQNRNVR